MTESTYQLRLDDDERRRYQLMAGLAVAQEADGWRRCGVVPGARVVDLGCGPGAVLVELARLVGADGTVTGIDQDQTAVGAALALIEAEGLANAHAQQGEATRTGLEPGRYDVVMIRHVLAHNGPRVNDILRHAVDLLRPGGHVWAADMAANTIFVDPPDELVDAMLARYHQLHARAGNDLSVGPHLGSLFAAAGLTVLQRQAYVNVLSPFPSGGGPIWAARQALVAAGLATMEELERARARADQLARDPDSALFTTTYTAAGRRDAQSL